MSSPPVLTVWKSTRWFCCWMCWRSTPLFWQILCPQTPRPSSLPLISLAPASVFSGAVTSLVRAYLACVPAVGMRRVNAANWGCGVGGELPFRLCSPQIFVAVYINQSILYLFLTQTQTNFSIPAFLLLHLSCTQCFLYRNADILRVLVSSERTKTMEFIPSNVFLQTALPPVCPWLRLVGSLCPPLGQALP